MMRRLSTVVGVTALSSLAVAGPVLADDASFLGYLNTHGFTPGAPADWMPDINVKNGHHLCGQLRAGFPLEDLRASMSPRYTVMIEAAQHEICPDTLGSTPSAPSVPTQGDDQSYLDYLSSHGFAPGTAADWMSDINVKNGHHLCGQLRSGFPVEDLRASMAPRYGVMIDAAQHGLCPDTLPAGQ